MDFETVTVLGVRELQTHEISFIHQKPRISKNMMHEFGVDRVLIERWDPSKETCLDLEWIDSAEISSWYIGQMVKVPNVPRQPGTHNYSVKAFERFIKFNKLEDAWNAFWNDQYNIIES